MGRLALACSLLFITLACVRASPVSAVFAEPARTTQTEPAAVFVETQPLSCDGTLMAIIGEQGVPMIAFEYIYELEVAKYRDRGRGIPQTADARYHKIISERVIYLEILVAELREQAILAAGGALTIPEDEIAAEYVRIVPGYTDDAPRVHAAHILILVGPDISEAEALAKAEAIHQQARRPQARAGALAESRGLSLDADLSP